MVFAGEYIFKKVKTGREGDRVYMLKYLSGTVRLMFWLQDKGAEKDAELIQKVNDCLANPNAAADAAAERARASASAAGGAGGAGAGGLTQEDFMRMMGISPPSMRPPPSASGGAAPAAASGAPSGDARTVNPAPFGNLDLSSLLSTLATQPPAGGAAQPQSQQSQSSQQQSNNDESSGDEGKEGDDAAGDGAGSGGPAPMDE